MVLLLLNDCDLRGAEKDALDGSIKNWPSILRCCLGGVRGTGQIGITVGSSLTSDREVEVAEARELYWCTKGERLPRYLSKPRPGNIVQDLFLSLSSDELPARFSYH